MCVDQCVSVRMKAPKNNMSAVDGYMLYYISFVLYEVVNTWSPVAWNSVNLFLK